MSTLLFDTPSLSYYLCPPRIIYLQYPSLLLVSVYPAIYRYPTPFGKKRIIAETGAWQHGVATAIGEPGALNT